MAVQFVVPSSGGVGPSEDRLKAELQTELQAGLKTRKEA